MVQVQCLVGELRSHKLRTVAKKKEYKPEGWFWLAEISGYSLPQMVKYLFFLEVNRGLHATRKHCLFPVHDAFFFISVFSVLMMGLVTVAMGVF